MSLVVLMNVNDQAPKTQLDETLVHPIFEESQTVTNLNNTYSTISEECAIQIKFQEKAISINDRNYFVFRVYLKIPDAFNT
jgi:hypothetical protein